MNRPIAPFDVVVLPAGLAEAGLPPGTRAVVIEIHTEPYEALEIEVVDDDGRTIFSGAVETAWVELAEGTDQPGDTDVGGCGA